MFTGSNNEKCFKSELTISPIVGPLGLAVRGVPNSSTDRQSPEIDSQSPLRGMLKVAQALYKRQTYIST